MQTERIVRDGNSVVLLFIGGLFFFAFFGCLVTNPQITTSYDFSAYYASFQLFILGENPYDPQLLDVYQKQLGHFFDFEPAQMWYGPWTFVLMAPVLKLPYHYSAALWFCMQFVFMSAASIFMWRSVSKSSIALSPCILAGAFFVPHLSTLVWGQMGLFLAFGVAGFLWSIGKERDFLAGLFLLPLTLKPHLFFLFGIVVFWFLCSEKRFKPLLSLIVILLLLSLASLGLSPEIFSYWLKNSGTPPFHQMTPTLAGALRGLYYESTGTAPLWPAFVFPIAAMLGTLVCLVLRRPKIDLVLVVPPIIAFSLFMAPYSFVHDQSMLMLLQVLLIAWSWQPEISMRRRKRVCAAVVSLQLLTLLLRACCLDKAPDFFWFPVAMLILWYLCKKPLKREHCLSQ